MAQCVVRPFVDASGSARLIERLLKRVARRDVALVLAQRQKPLAEIWLNLHEAALRRLRLRGFDFDQAAVEINLAPIQSLQFRAPQTGKESDGDVRQHVRRCAFQYPAS